MQVNYFSLTAEQKNCTCRTRLVLTTRPVSTKPNRVVVQTNRPKRKILSAPEYKKKKKRITSVWEPKTFAPAWCEIHCNLAGRLGLTWAMWFTRFLQPKSLFGSAIIVFATGRIQLVIHQPFIVFYDCVRSVNIWFSHDQQCGKSSHPLYIYHSIRRVWFAEWIKRLFLVDLKCHAWTSDSRREHEKIAKNKTWAIQTWAT